VTEKKIITKIFKFPLGGEDDYDYGDDDDDDNNNNNKLILQ
jgi:hypothetical protein